AAQALALDAALPKPSLCPSTELTCQCHVSLNCALWLCADSPYRYEFSGVAFAYVLLTLSSMTPSLQSPIFTHPMILLSRTCRGRSTYCWVTPGSQAPSLSAFEA